MSFLYDSDVFKSLVDSLKSETLIKNAADPVVANNADFVVAKALADQLYSELKFEKPQPTITSGKGTLELNVKTIKNFGTFMQNLSDHEVMVDGVRLVYPMEIGKDKATELDLGIVTTSPYGERDKENRKFDSHSFYVNAKALRSYLESLKQMAEGADAPEIILPYVNTLILNFNKYFRDLAIDRAKKFDAETGAQIGDETVLDNIDKYYVYPDNPRKGVNIAVLGLEKQVGSLSPYPITVRDLKNFNSMLNSFTVFDEGVGKSIIKRPDELEKLKCMILNVLLERSNYYMAAATADKKHFAKYYNNQVKNLMSQSNCEVSIGTGKEDKEDKDKGDMSREDLQKLQGWLSDLSSAHRLPLSMDAVNVPRIMFFVTEYAKLLEQFNSQAYPPVNSKLSQIKQVIGALNNMMGGGGANNLIFNLKSPPVAFSTNLNGGIRTLAPFLNSLKNLVQYTSAVTMHMEHHYGRELGRNLTRLRSQHSVIVRDNMDMLQSFIKNYATPKRRK